MINNFLFILFIHPLMLSLMLFLKSLLICLLMGVMFNTYWFSYILFLIFIGGVLILFMYVISLISNEKFLLMKNKIIMMFMLMMLLILMNFNMMLLNYNNYDLNLILINKNENLNLNKLFNFPTSLINIMLIIYLLFMMIISIKISNIFLGPLRIN